MLLKSALLAASFLAAIPVALAQQETPQTIRLCTGAEGGVYNQAGEMISNFAPTNHPIEVIVTGGTMNNMDRLLAMRGTADACDAMIGQPDGPVYLKRTSPASASKIVGMMKLHAEYLQVLCSAESGVKNLSDLSSDPKKYTVAIGENGSGAWLIWQNFIEQDSSYADIPTTTDSGITALAMLSSGNITCMLNASGVPNKAVAEADSSYGDTINLTPADDKDFNDAVDIDGKPLYTWRDIPTTSYPTTYNRYWSGVQTVSWNAGIYINKDKLKGKDLEAFLTAVTRARPQILSQFGK